MLSCIDSVAEVMLVSVSWWEYHPLLPTTSRSPRTLYIALFGRWCRLAVATTQIFDTGQAGETRVGSLLLGETDYNSSTGRPVHVEYSRVAGFAPLVFAIG